MHLIAEGKKPLPFGIIERVQQFMMRAPEVESGNSRGDVTRGARHCSTLERNARYRSTSLGNSSCFIPLKNLWKKEVPRIAAILRDAATKVVSQLSTLCLFRTPCIRFNSVTNPDATE